MATQVNKNKMKKFFFRRRINLATLLVITLLSVAVTVIFPQTVSIAGFNWKGFILAAVLLLLTNVKQLKKLHPIVYIAASAVIGIIFKM